MSYRVVVADDHPLARQAICSLLEEDGLFDIISEAVDGMEAVEHCRTLRPDVLLTDINMPELSGLEVTRILKQEDPQLKVVLLTVSDSASDLFTALQYGAQGYLLKNMDPDDWLAYLHALLDDRREVSQDFTERLFQQFKPGGVPHPTGAAMNLTPREQEIVRYVTKGETNRQIAVRLTISENTVKNHLKNILEKLSLDNRVQLTSYAIKHGLSLDAHNNSDK